MHRPQDYVWKASYGRDIPVSRMTSEHLVNALNWIEKHNESGHYEQPNSQQADEGYFYLKQEAMRRGLRWRYFRGRCLADGDISPQLFERMREKYERFENSTNPNHVQLCQLEPGRQFFRGQQRFMKCRLYGAVSRGLQLMGYQPVDHGYARSTTMRYPVVNLSTGGVWLLPAYEEVQPII